MKFLNMKNSFNTSKTEKYGNVHFISFMGSVLSRLAYENDNQFLDKYLKIIGQVITPEILTCMNSVPSTDLKQLLDDQETFKLNGENSKLPVELYNGKKYIAFAEMADRINQIIADKSVVMPPVVQPSIMQPPNMQPSIMQPSIMQPPIMQPSNMQPSNMQPSNMQPSNMQPSNMQPSNMQPSNMQPPIMQPPIMQPPIMQPPNMQPPNMQPGMPQTMAPVMGTSFGGENTDGSVVKYISIGWSNYGEVYVVADKRMRNTLFLLFRGTYSPKTAGSYAKPSSLIPIAPYAGSKEQYLYGIFKITVDMIHTIVEAMRYLAVDFLGQTEPESVKIFTASHSIGAAMSTIFSYLWMGIRKTSPYDKSPYDVLASNIICMSLGSPRCMNSIVANKFCDLVNNGNILYLRIVTGGDIVTSLPPRTQYEHPCSSNPEMRKVVSEDCYYPRYGSKSNLDCRNTKRMISSLEAVTGMLPHTNYLYITFANAINFGSFGASTMDIGGIFSKKTGIETSMEVKRLNGQTVCRLVMGEGSSTQPLSYKTVFFNVNKTRVDQSNQDADEEQKLSNENTVATIDESTHGTSGGAFFTSKPSDVPKKSFMSMFTRKNTPTNSVPTKTSYFTNLTKKVSSVGKMVSLGKINEDILITKDIFDKLIDSMEDITQNKEKCPVSPPNGLIIEDIFDKSNQMPVLSRTTDTPSDVQINQSFGGKKTRKSRKRKTRRHRKKKNHTSLVLQ